MAQIACQNRSQKRITNAKNIKIMETLKQRIEKANKIIKDNLHQKTSEIIFLCRETFIDTSTLLVFIENHRKNEVN